jgi:hypothetical protein
MSMCGELEGCCDALLTAKYVTEHYAVNENRRPLLGNGFGYHGITGVSGTTQT